MRKNAPRKWIHAILDLLPLLVIPIFAIYTRNESNTFENNIELQVEQNKVVDFNQVVQNGDFSTTDNWYNVAGNVSSFEVNNNECNVTYAGYLGCVAQRIHIEPNDIYVARIDLIESNNNLQFLIFNDTTQRYVMGRDITSGYVGSISLSFTSNTTSYNDNCRIGLLCRDNSDFNTSIFTYVNLFNITQMFGSGNEPTLTQFNEWYSNDYYDYTLSEKQLLKNVSTQTLNNTDIGSQFLYSIYKPINDYFNFNNLFNMQGIYDWLQLNLFSGNAPLPVLIVWNIIVYEFFIDLIFLLYSVFMFIIDWSTSMLDKFLYKSRC